MVKRTDSNDIASGSFDNDTLIVLKSMSSEEADYRYCKTNILYCIKLIHDLQNNVVNKARILERILNLRQHMCLTRWVISTGP